MTFAAQGIPLGKWFGIRVELHWLFVLFAAFNLFNAGANWQAEAFFSAMLFGTVLLHEFGHCFACRSVGGTAQHIVLWPLGGLAMVAPPPRPWAQLWTTVGGPLVNVILIPTCYLLLRFVVPLLPANTLAQSTLLNITFFGLLINLFLLVFNVLPVYPMDGGRILQEILWLMVGLPRSLLIAGMTGTVGGLAFIALGLDLVHLSLPIIPSQLAGDPILHALGESLGTDFGVMRLGGQRMLIFIGIMAAMASFQIYRQAEEMMRWRRQ